MFKKVSYRLLKSGIAVIIVTYFLALTMFFPGSATPILAQNNARLSVAPNPANPGATIMVNGFEYPAAKKVAVYFQNKANGVVSATTNAGGFFNAALKLPKNYINGTTYVYATCDGSTTKALLKSVKPALSYTPALKSTRASFKGTGFIANESVSFVLKDGNKISKRGMQRTDSQGHFALTLALPDMPLGSKATLTVNDVAKTHVSIEARYSPQIQLSTFVGPIRRRVSVTGRGFEGGEQVYIEFQGVLVGAAIADRNGDFVTRFNVPTWAGYSYYNDVAAIGRQSGASASDSFQVLPSVSLSSNTGLPGRKVTVTGSQFTPSKSVQALLFSPSQGASSVGTPLVNAGVSSHGTFKTDLTIPADVQRRTVYSILYVDVASGLNIVTYFKVQ